MVLNIVTEQIKETPFLSQVSRSYLSNLDGEPPSKIKGWTKNAENANGCLLLQKLIISASTLLRKPCLGSKLGYSTLSQIFDLGPTSYFDCDVEKVFSKSFTMFPDFWHKIKNRA